MAVLRYIGRFVVEILSLAFSLFCFSSPIEFGWSWATALFYIIGFVALPLPSIIAVWKWIYPEHRDWWCKPALLVSLFLLTLQFAPYP